MQKVPQVQQQKQQQERHHPKKKMTAKENLTKIKANTDSPGKSGKKKRKRKQFSMFLLLVEDALFNASGGRLKWKTKKIKKESTLWAKLLESFSHKNFYPWLDNSGGKKCSTFPSKTKQEMAARILTMAKAAGGVAMAAVHPAWNATTLAGEQKRDKRVRSHLKRIFFSHRKVSNLLLPLVDPLLTHPNHCAPL